MNKKISIFYKFLFIMLFLSVVPLVIAGIRIININRLGFQDVILELHTKQALSISEAVESYMKTLREKIKFALSSQEDSNVMNWDMSQRMLRSMIASSSELLTVSAVSNTGKELTKVYHPSLEGKVKLENRASDPTFIASHKAEASAISRLYYVENIPRLNIVYPFTKDIYLYIEASLADLMEKVKRSTVGETGFAYIIDDTGHVVMHPDITKAINSQDMTDLSVVNEVLSRKLIGSKEFITSEGKAVISAYAPIAALNWGVIVQQDKDEAYSTVNSMRKNAEVILVIVLIAASFIGYFMAQNLTSPVLKLTAAARNIAAGQFEVEVVSEWLKKARLQDELSEFAHTFIIMTQQLKKYTDMQADKMNAVLFSIADGIIMTDYAGNITLSNRRAKELLGISLKESIENKQLKDIIDHEEIFESLREVREKRIEIKKEIDLSEGSERKILRSETSIVSHSESGQDIGIVTVIKDITLEKEIAQLKEDFVHSITHDLRSPMTSIRGFLEFLLDGSTGELNEQQKEFLEIIDKSSLRLLEMINDLLDVAKMESGSMPIDKAPFVLVDTVQNIVKSLASQAVKNKIALEVFEQKGQGEYGKGKDAEFEDVSGSGLQGVFSYTKSSMDIIGEIVADERLIHRAITNLLGNALKFTPEGGRINIVLTDFEECVQISVEDTGPGLTPEYLDKVFDKFEQVKGRSGRTKGTGLGLTITRYIIESHKGQIWVESEVGQGAKFKFWIPKK